MHVRDRNKVAAILLVACGLAAPGSVLAACVSPAYSVQTLREAFVQAGHAPLPTLEPYLRDGFFVELGCNLPAGWSRRELHEALGDPERLKNGRNSLLRNRNDALLLILAAMMEGTQGQSGAQPKK